MNDAGIYERCWYLCRLLVFMSDAGIYARCWYLWMMLVFTSDVVFMHDTGIYERCWYLCTTVYKNRTIGVLKRMSIKTNSF